MIDRKEIAAVCGNEVRIYGTVGTKSYGMSGRRPYPVPYNVSSSRPLLEVLVFAHHGAALEYAQWFEDRQK